MCKSRSGNSANGPITFFFSSILVSSITTYFTNFHQKEKKLIELVFIVDSHLKSLNLFISEILRKSRKCLKNFTKKTLSKWQELGFTFMKATLEISEEKK